MKPAIKKKPQLVEESVENISKSVTHQTTGIASDVAKNLWKDFFLGTTKNVLKEPIWGADSSAGTPKRGGDLTEGQEVSLKKQEKKMEHKSRHQEVYFDEIRRPERTQMQESSMIVQKIDEILGELRKLANSTTEMQSVHKEMASESRPVKPGTYHLNFYEFLLTVLRSARMKIEESANWKNAFASKKKQRQYGAMAKKHGTSFSLSSERTTATQTG